MLFVSPEILQLQCLYCQKKNVSTKSTRASVPFFLCNCTVHAKVFVYLGIQSTFHATYEA